MQGTIPVDQTCRTCGNITWRAALGASDRHWLDGYACEACIEDLCEAWCGLVTLDGKTEWNARAFCDTSALEHGRIYTLEELHNDHGLNWLLKTNDKEALPKRLRFVRGIQRGR